jgi:hypothetical protein
VGETEARVEAAPKDRVEEESARRHHCCGTQAALGNDETTLGGKAETGKGRVTGHLNVTCRALCLRPTLVLAAWWFTPLRHFDKRTGEPDAAKKCLVHSIGYVRGQNDDSFIRLHSLEQEIDLDIGVPVVSIFDS